VAGYPGILQPLIKELRFNEGSQRRGIDEMISFSEETEDAADYREWNSIFKFLALDISDYRIISGLAERVRSPCLSASVVLEL
jgi:hypothetical protein